MRGGMSAPLVGLSVSASEIFLTSFRSHPTVRATASAQPALLAPPTRSPGFLPPLHLGNRS